MSYFPAKNTPPPTGGGDSPESLLIRNNKLEIKGIVKGERFSSLDSLTDEVIREVANEYGVDFGYAKQKVKDIELWCKANGKIKKDYKATLQTWIRGDIEKGKARKASKPVEAPVMVTRTAEEIRASQEKLNAIREKTAFLAKSKSIGLSKP